MTEKEIFDKVLFIGPNLNRLGGMMSVLNSYKNNFPNFHYLATNYLQGEIHKYAKLINPFVFLWVIIKLPFYRLFTKTKILHIHHASQISFPRKSIIARFGKVLGFKVIMHCHGRFFEKYTRQVGKKRIQKTLDKADAIIVLSKMWQTFFKEELGYDSIIINNPIEKYETADKGKSVPLNILYIGLIAQEKGVFDIVDVVSAHKSEYIGKIKISIAGPGAIEELNSKINDTKVNNIISYIGCVSGQTKIDLLKKTDILLHPSYFEGLPICILEAMANGCGIITTTVGGIPEIIAKNKNGFLLEPGNKDAIDSAIKSYIQNPALISEHGKISLKKVAPFYIDNVRKQLADVYTDLLEKKK